MSRLGLILQVGRLHRRRIEVFDPCDDPFPHSARRDATKGSHKAQDLSGRRHGAGLIQIRTVGPDRRWYNNHLVALPVVTGRERMILTLAAGDRTAIETAALFAMSGETVEFHLRKAVRKLSSANKTDAAVQALKLGLIDTESRSRSH